MADYDVAFVDSITSSPAVRLDLHSASGGWACLADGTEFPPPELARVAPQSMMADGGIVTSAAYRNRPISLALEAPMSLTADAAAALVQTLAREIDRPGGNILRYRSDTTQAVFFRTFRSGFDAVDWDPVQRRAHVSLLAEPFAYGPEEILSPVTVYNDPAEGVTLNSNPNVDANVTNWSASGGTVALNTTTPFSGAGAGQLTPSGAANTVFAQCEEVPVVAGQPVRGSARLRVPSVRTVDLQVRFVDTGHNFVSSLSCQSRTTTANTYQSYDGTVTAPADGFARLAPTMTGTPVPASDVLLFDEARIRVPGSSGGMYLDIAAPKGDVETPLYLTLAGTLGTGGAGQGSRQLGVSVRRRGTPSALPIVLQAESMTQGTDTSVQANSLLMSGSGSNFSRCTFVTGAMSTRLSGTWPPTASTDARGTYRVFVRLRQNTSADVFDVRLQFGSSTTVVTNADVRLPPDTGLGAPTIKYVDLGLMQVPVGYDPVTDGMSGVELAAQGLFVSVGARRVTGSGSVDFDCVLFVPTDDRGLLLIGLPEVQATPSDTYVVEGGPRAAMYVQNVSGALVSGPQPVISGVGQMITPGRTNRVYVFRDLGTNAAQIGSGDDITGSMTVTPSYWPRYLSPVRPVTS